MSQRGQVLLERFLLTVLVAGAATVGQAQSTATLRGTITDPQGAVTPGVTITMRSQTTGLERTAVSGADGTYVAASLPPGQYHVEATLQGFQTQTREVELGVAQTVVADLKLGVAGVTEQVSVTASAPVIDTATSSVGQVITQRVVQEIPLNGRHFVDLGLLIPGSITPPQNGFLSAPLRGQGSFAFNTAGNREDTVNFMINGVNLNDPAQNQITFQPSINTVSEFKVDNSTFSAEYGRNSGAIVNIATRSGANDIHGEAFEYFRDNSLDSRNFFNQEPAPQSTFRRNQFGVNFGGPIVKNKTFFFGTYEGLRQRQGIDINSGVLSDAQRAAVTDPVSRRLLPLIPTSNATGAAGEARFVGSATAPVDIDQFTGDVRHNVNNTDSVHWYYAWQRDQRGEPTLQLNTVPGFGDTRHSHRQIMTLNETHIFGSTLVNEARFGFNRIDISFDPNAKLNPLDYGISDGVTTAIGIPQITIVGVGLNFGGPGPNFPQGRTDTSFVFSDTATYLRGRNAIKLGGEFRRILNDNFTSDVGTFQFGSLGAFQAGLGSNFSITLGDRPSNVRQSALGLFVQDTLQATPKLSFDLGLRYDGIMSPTETDGRYVVFDTTSGALAKTSDPYATSHNLQPRVGMVWNPTGDGRSVVRGAYAVMVDMPVANVVSVTSANPPLATPLTFAGNIRLDSAVATALAGGLAPQSVNPNFQPGRMQTWNVNFEQQIGPALGVMVGYFGSHGDRLRITLNANQPVNGIRPFPTISRTSAILPGNALGNVVETNSLGWSNYKGLWVTASERPLRGLQFNASYTLAKSEDTNSLSTGTIVVQDSNNIADSYGPSDFDVRHRFVINAIYDLPFKGNRAVEGWQLSVVTQAQTGSPVNLVIASGTFNGVANTVRPDLLDLSRSTGSHDPTIIGSPTQWFGNSVCDPVGLALVFGLPCDGWGQFALPVNAAGVGHFGNLGRNAILGPGFGNTDFSVIKNLALVGGARLQFRAEIFNLFNQANLGLPGRIVALGSTSFGVITNTRFPTGDSGSARQVQFALKILF
jgi:Carboxypeptidase regulatory-like domain/TonB dependent receptor